MPEKTPQEIKAFVEKYKEVYTQIFQLYGASKSEGDLNDLTKVETGELKKSDKWKPNDSTEIELYTYLSNQHNSNKFSNPTYRIRLKVSNPIHKSDDALKPEGKKLDSLDAMFKKFIIELRDSHLVNVRECMSDLVKNAITNEQLGDVAKAIHFNDSLVIYLTGIQMGPDGGGYPMLKYRYKSGSDNIANEMISVIFDKDNKILGVQPMKRQ